jgi:hypothetical protein
MPPLKRPSKTASPPRAKGPKRRDTRGAPPWRKLALAAGVAAAALIAGVTISWLGGGNGGVDQKSVEQALAAADCTLKTFADQGQNHVSSYEAKVKSNSFPPTSGTHHEVPVIWGVYEEPVIRVQEVHNLEHGGVVIHYGDEVDAATRAQLRAFYDDSPDGMLLSPLAKLGNRISLTAWTQLATCERFDEDAFAAFRSAYRGNGPERFRVGDLRPGT